MNLQGRNLYLRMRGEDVKLLQSELRQLGFSIGDEEGYFGKATRRAVLKFQEEQGLEPTGKVEERTAEVINTAVATLQPEPRPEDRVEPLTVTGRVLQDGEPLAGMVVRSTASYAAK
jgi:peptidoglycan hydrolase-like protein with peptidoglycan-binding domain